MSGIRFTPQQIAELSKLPVVAKITPKMLVFTQGFKRFAVEQTKQGKTIYSIVSDAGIDTKLFVGGYLYTQLKAWRKQNLNPPPKSKGRPKSPLPKPSSASLTKDQLLSKLALLEAENEFLKKVRAPSVYPSATCMDLSSGRRKEG